MIGREGKEDGEGDGERRGKEWKGDKEGERRNRKKNRESGNRKNIDIKRGGKYNGVRKKQIKEVRRRRNEGRKRVRRDK